MRILVLTEIRGGTGYQNLNSEIILLFEGENGMI